MNCDKVIKDGKVAVLYSPQYGAGWYSWNTETVELLFDADIVNSVLVGDLEKAANIAKTKYDIYAGGACSLEVKWLPQGTAFIVDEYDGYESIQVMEEIEYLIA